MKRKMTVFIACILLCTGMATVSAAPSAEKLYTSAQSMDPSTQSLKNVMASYDKLGKRVAKEVQDARKDLAKARSRGDANQYWDAYNRLEALSSYSMGKDQSDRILSGILAEDEASKEQDAQWLYRNSAYYRPALTLDFSAKGDSYNYRFHQQVTKVPGSDITLPDSSRLQIDSSRLGILAGWGVTPDAVTYKGGDTIKMPYTDQTLYAIWKDAVRFTDSIGKNDIVDDDVSDGGEVSVPVPEAPDASYIFAGWYDGTSRTLLKGQDSFTLKGKGAQFEALWKGLDIESIEPIYYAGDKLATGTQIDVGFSFHNKGNMDLKGLRAILSTPDDSVTIVDDTVLLGTASAGRYRNNSSWFASSKSMPVQGNDNSFRFVIEPDVASGTVIPFTVTISDSDGDSWSSTVSYTVQ